jgi:hypothetical protein
VSSFEELERDVRRRVLRSALLIVALALTAAAGVVGLLLVAAGRVR